jgi:hypothetical protein
MMALAGTLLLALPGVAMANDTESGEETAPTEAEQPVQVEELSSTLPILGTGLAVSIQLDENGKIASVALDPDNPGAEGATVEKQTDHKVMFLLADGDTEIVVKAKKNYVVTKVKADSTDDIDGPGIWSADVFGNGEITVPYTVTFDGAVPTIEVGEITLPDGVSAEVGELRSKASEDGNKAFAALKVEFTSGDQTAKLILSAKVFVNDEGETRVSVAATLAARDHVKCWNRHGEWRDHDRDDDVSGANDGAKESAHERVGFHWDRSDRMDWGKHHDGDGWGDGDDDRGGGDDHDTRHDD